MTAPISYILRTMKTTRLTLVVAMSVVLFGAAAAAGPTVRLAEVQGPITPATSWYLEIAVEAAEAAGDTVLLVEMDTPGGLVASTETIVKSFLGADVPIVVFVTPSGAHAASAGFYILMSADVAAMAPGTRTGAASVVFEGRPSDPDDILLKKATEDAAALVRGIAERRGRNVEAAERTVLEAKAYTETIALENGLIDLVVADRDALIAALDGREVRRFDGTTVTLDLADATVVPVEIDFAGRVLQFVAHPGVAYLLLIVGSLGLWVEFQNPGLIVPGVVGGICLVLFAVASSVLPVSAIGILLIVLSLVLFALEVKVVSHGLLTIGGIIAIVAGSMLLIDGPIPELRVPASVYLPISLAAAALLAFTVYKVGAAQRVQVATGVEGLVGETAEVRTAIDPEGKVFVHGEIWDAVSVSRRIDVGERVRVIRVDAMRLFVEPRSAEPSAPPEE